MTNNVTFWRICVMSILPQLPSLTPSFVGSTFMVIQCCTQLQNILLSACKSAEVSDIFVPF